MASSTTALGWYRVRSLQTTCFWHCSHLPRSPLGWLHSDCIFAAVLEQMFVASAVQMFSHPEVDGDSFASLWCPSKILNHVPRPVVLDCFKTLTDLIFRWTFYSFETLNFLDSTPEALAKWFDLLEVRPIVNEHPVRLLCVNQLIRSWVIKSSLSFLDSACCIYIWERYFGH